MDNEKAVANFMGIGCKAFREGRYLYAQQVFGAVSRYDPA